MSQPLLLLCSTIIIAQTHISLAVSVQNLKKVDKRLINGSPINSTYFEESWYFTATIEIWHRFNGTWLRHPTCLGSFLHVSGKFMIVTTADCFFPPGYDHTHFSYKSKNNYRVFLGLVRIRYGSISSKDSDQFGLRSTVLHPLVKIHPEWKFGNSTESSNIAAVIITSKCMKTLDAALAKRQITKVPAFVQSVELDGPVGGLCMIAGWNINLSDDFDPFSRRKDLKVELLLDYGLFLSQNSFSCNQHFSLLNLPKHIEDSTFCISPLFGDCVELYLTSYEYGSGVVCNGTWSGFVSAIVNKGPVVSGIPQVQFGTVTSAAMIRQFVYETHFNDGIKASCRVGFLDKSRFGAGDTNGFNPNSAKDYAAP